MTGIQAGIILLNIILCLDDNVSISALDTGIPVIKQAAENISDIFNKYFFVLDRLFDDADMHNITQAFT